MQAQGEREGERKESEEGFMEGRERIMPRVRMKEVKGGNVRERRDRSRRRRIKHFYNQ